MGEYRQLTKRDRVIIETMINNNCSQSEIARYLGVHRSTICRELRRGQYIHLNSDYTEEERYSCDLAQEKHDWNMQAKGGELKIGKDIELANYIEGKITEEKYSPEAVLADIKNRGIEFKVTISLSTLYRYIDRGVFLNLTNKDLPVKGRKKSKHRRVRVQKRASAGESIDRRPEEISTRETFGHWEMDTVKGKRGTTKSCLLVLSERKTRKEIIYKLPDQTSLSVVKALNHLENKWGKIFSNVFKTITVDNGVEFSDCKGMETSANNSEKRTNIFYCHAYSSWERGTNENINKLIRRHVPKGVNFDKKTDEEIMDIENWINNYPRRIFNYRTSAELFEKELINLAI